MLRSFSLTLSLLAVAVLLLVGQAAFAQGGNGGNGGGGRGGNRGGGGMDVRNFATQLNLTPEQLTKINDLVKAENVEIIKLLTPEQQKMLKEQPAPLQRNIIPLLPMVKLTDEQTPKVKAIQDTLMTATRDAMQNANGDFAAAQTKMAALQAKASQDILALLTPEQIKAMQTPLAQMYGKLQGLQAPRGAGMDQDLRTKLRTMRQDALKEADTIRNDAALNDEQKLVKMTELYTKTIKLIKEALTPEQQKTFQASVDLANKEPMINTRPLQLTQEQRTAIRPITQKANQDIQAVLTEEQKTKLQTLRPTRAGGPGQPAPAPAQ